MRESDYQMRLIKKIEKLLPGCLVLKNDPNYRQGIPDLTIFYKNKWAFLEVKPHVHADEQPNQRYYIEQASDYSFGEFISPEREEYVLDALVRHMSPPDAAAL